MHPYEFKGTDNPLYWDFSNTTDVVGECSFYRTKDHVASDLETPVKISFQLNLSTDYYEANCFRDNVLSIFGKYNKIKDQYELNEDYAEFTATTGVGDASWCNVNLSTLINNNPTEYDIKLAAVYQGDPVQTVVLCSMTLQDLTLFMKEGKTLNFVYNSETGLVFLNTSESETGSLLSLQTYTDSGDFLVKSLFTNKFMLPGEFTYPDFYSSKLKFKIYFNKRTFENNN